VSRIAVSILPEAEADIRDSYYWYRERSAIAANGFRVEVLAAIDDLARSARMWPRDESGVHRRVLNRFPYSIQFEVTEAGVTVLALSHHRRLPRYWQGR
jgi:plasmid stabilization system protein ParE